MLNNVCRLGAFRRDGAVAWPCARRRTGREAPLARPDAARRRPEGRAAGRLFVDERAGRPAAVQDLHRRDRHQGQLCARIRHPADGPHRDRVPHQAEGVGHHPDHHHQQDAGADVGAGRSLGGEGAEPRCDRAGPPLVRHVRQLQRPGVQHQAGEARRPAEDLRGVPDQEAVGEPRRDRRHRQRMAQGDVRALRRAARHRDHQGHRRDAESGRHRRSSRAGARHRRRRIRDLAEQLRQPVDEREARRRPDRRLGDGPGRADVRPGRRERARAQSQRGEAGGELHDQPGGPAVHRQVRPPADPQRRQPTIRPARSRCFARKRSSPCC